MKPNASRAADGRRTQFGKRADTSALPIVASGCYMLLAALSCTNLVYAFSLLSPS
jgi:hypothetical protein